MNQQETIVISGLAELRVRVGQEVAVSDWRVVDQRLLDDFARVTGDDQWIHVDVERARNSPMGGTIAHGLLTVGLGPRFTYDSARIDGFAFGMNYGYDRIRFPAPLPAGSRVRMRSTLAAVDDIDGGVQITVTETFEREGEAKPVCVAEHLSRLYFE